MLYNDLASGNRGGQDKLPSASLSYDHPKKQLLSGVFPWFQCLEQTVCGSIPCITHDRHWCWGDSGGLWQLGVIIWNEFFSWSNIHFEVESHWEQIKHEENKSIVLKSRTKMMGKLLGGLAFTVTPEGLCNVSAHPTVVGKAGCSLGGNTCNLKAFRTQAENSGWNKCPSYNEVSRKRSSSFAFCFMLWYLYFGQEHACVGVRQSIKSVPVFRHVLKKMNQKTETLNIPPCLGNIACPSSDDKKMSKWRTV